MMSWPQHGTSWFSHDDGALRTGAGVMYGGSMPAGTNRKKERKASRSDKEKDGKDDSTINDQFEL